MRDEASPETRQDRGPLDAPKEVNRPPLDPPASCSRPASPLLAPGTAKYPYFVRRSGPGGPGEFVAERTIADALWVEIVGAAGPKKTCFLVLGEPRRASGPGDL